MTIQHLIDGARKGLQTIVETAEGIITSYHVEEYIDGANLTTKSTVTGQDLAQITYQVNRDKVTKNLTEKYANSSTGMYHYTHFDDHPRFGSTVRYPNSKSISDGWVEKVITRSGTVTLNNPSDMFDIDEYYESITQNWKTTTIVYDGATSKYTSTSPEGILSYVTIDSQEKATQIQEASFHPVDFTYDADGRLQRIEHTSARPTEYTYNINGYISKSENALGEETFYTYDSAGRLLTKTLPDTRVIAYTYDDNGNMTSLTTPSSITHDMSYNDFDLMSGYLTTASTTYTYNDDRQVTQITRPNSDTINYTYSSTRGRLTGITTSAGNYVITQNTGGWNYPDSIESPDGSIVSFYQFGDLNWQTTWSGATSGQVAFGYNNDHLISSVTVNSEPQYTLTYNNDNQLIAVGDEVITRSTTHGKITNATLGNAYEDYTYSSFGELSSITGEYSTTPVYSASYTRDDLGRIETLSEKYGAGATQNYEYIYDSSGRLTDVKLGGAVINSYTYDANSNRTSATYGMTTINATYTSYDQLITHGTKTYSYNSNGELIQVVDSSSMPSGVYSYTYDTFGYLKTVTLPNADVYEYILDGLHRRVGVKLNSTLIKQYIWQDQYKIVAELDGSGTMLSEFIYGTRINVPDYIRKGSDVYKVMTNHLGSVVAVVHTSTGVVAQEIKYDEFGRVLSDTSPGFQPFGFAGGLYDSDTKLVRFGARDYDGETGRWLSKDPILFNGGDTNLYGYVLMDPVNFVDPYGTFSLPDPRCVAMFAVGGAGTGAGIGFIIGNGLGAAVGGVGGFVGGAVGGFFICDPPPPSGGTGQNPPDGSGAGNVGGNQDPGGGKTCT